MVAIIGLIILLITWRQDQFQIPMSVFESLRVAKRRHRLVLFLHHLRLDVEILFLRINWFLHGFLLNYIEVGKLRHCRLASWRNHVRQVRQCGDNRSFVVSTMNLGPPASIVWLSWSNRLALLAFWLLALLLQLSQRSDLDFVAKEIIWNWRLAHCHTQVKRLIVFDDLFVVSSEVLYSFNVVSEVVCTSQHDHGLCCVREQIVGKRSLQTFLG